MKNSILVEMILNFGSDLMYRRLLENSVEETENETSAFDLKNFIVMSLVICMNEENIISWTKDYYLTWSDFRAEPNPALFEDAYSFIKYRCTWTVNSESFGSEIKFSITDIVVTPEFHRHLSWVRIPLSTPELLIHEQGHFDLAELLKTEVIQNLKLLFENKWYSTRGQNEEQRKQYAREDSGAMIAKEVQKWEEILLQKHQDYDKQTDFGQISEKQTEFNATFSQLR